MFYVRGMYGIFNYYLYLDIDRKAEEMSEEKTKYTLDRETYNGLIRRAGETIPQRLERIVGYMCANYCKYPGEWDEDAEGMELSESDICRNCPLNELI